MIPSIPSLTRICDAFGITLSQFFLEETGTVVLINERQSKLLHHASKLDPKQYDALISFLESL